MAGWAENSGSRSCRLHGNPEVSHARPETPPQTQRAGSTQTTRLTRTHLHTQIQASLQEHRLHLTNKKTSCVTSACFQPTT